MTALHTQWLLAAGAVVVPAAAAGDETVVEIDAVVSVAGEGLETFAGRTFTSPVHVTAL